MLDIGLERDAFLYVSDFLELTGDEEDEEFGEIPAPRTTVDFARTPTQQQAASAAESAPAVLRDTEDSTDFVAGLEDFPPPEGAAEGDDEGGIEETSSGTSETQDEEGARRWRGRRRRRGGRRGRPDERPERTEQPKVEAAKPEVQPRAAAEPVAEVHPEPRQERAAPPRYAPILLPGESISKYRNLASQPANEPSAPLGNGVLVVGEEQLETPEASLAPVVEEIEPRPAEFVESHPFAPEEHMEYAEGHVATEPEQLERAAAGFTHEHPHEEARREEASYKVLSVAEPVAMTAPAAEVSHLEAVREDEQEPDEIAPVHADDGADEATQVQDAPEERPEHMAQWARKAPSEHEAEPEHQMRFPHETDVPQRAAPAEAPQGRTLEHEVLEDDEMEFHPMPENIEALSEVAGDEELVLEEEIMDRDAYSDRWVPKIADVDEDEVIAAEERGENIFEGGNDEEEEEEDEAIEAAETNGGRAEVRSPAPTVGYQQRQSQRPGYDRNQRGRRGGGRRNNVRTRPHSNRPMPLITDLLKEGQEVLIQIAKEPIGKKGARITSHIALPGRFLVYMPTVNHVGVSRKIASDEERQRLKRIVTSERENGLGGFIVRTAAANIKEDELRSDIRFLKHLWAEIKNRAEDSKSPALIYHDLNLVERVLRDQVNADFSQIWVDTEDQYERVVRFASRFQPSLVKRIKLYTKDAPLYEHFGIQEEIDRSLKSKVWLKSGGYLVINQTEALVAIDINTGKYVGKTQRLEDTIVRTNVDAVKEIVRQIRLRDLGGIIVIDFIDMDERKNRQKVMQALEEAMRYDRAPSKVLQFNDFGLVAITRKRVKQSLERTLGETCPYCVGAGFVKSVPTVCNELYIEMRKMAKVHDRTDITVRVNPEVARRSRRITESSLRSWKS